MFYRVFFFFNLDKHHFQLQAIKFLSGGINSPLQQPSFVLKMLPESYISKQTAFFEETKGGINPNAGAAEDIQGSAE
jgi:hypothetical protein